jgi:hypothetical protein
LNTSIDRGLGKDIEKDREKLKRLQIVKENIERMAEAENLRYLLTEKKKAKRQKSVIEYRQSQ